MNIQEAIRSKRPFKRPEHVHYIFQTEESLVWDVPGNPLASFGPSIDDLCVGDLLAEDWEPQEERIELTYSQWVEFMKRSPSYLENSAHGKKITAVYWTTLKEITNG